MDAEPDNSLLSGIVLCTVGCLAASLAQERSQVTGKEKKKKKKKAMLSLDSPYDPNILLIGMETCP